MKFTLFYLAVFCFAYINCSKLVHLSETEDDYNSKIQNAGDKLVVVDFFAQWCRPCKKIAPVLEKYAQKYASNIVVIKVDVDELQELALELGVSSMPTFIFFKDGQKVHRLVGANPVLLEEAIVAKSL